MEFFNAPIKKNIEIKRATKVLKNPVVYFTHENPDIWLVLDKPYNSSFYQHIIKQIEKEVISKHKVTPTINIISTFPFKPEQRDLKTGLIKFYTYNHIDFKKYIKPHSKIIADPRSLYALTESDDFEIDGFYDFIFNQSHLYLPELKSYVFPIDSYEGWIKGSENNYFCIDTWPYFFALKQFNEAYSFVVKPKRKPILNLIDILDGDKWLIENTSDELIKMAWDIETGWKNPKIEGNGLDPWNKETKIICLTVSFDGVTGYHIDFGNIKDKSLLNNFFKNKLGILQNGKFDAKFMILKAHVKRENIYIYYDTWNGSHVVNELQRSSLKSDVWLYTQFGGYDNDLEKYKDKHPKSKKDYGKIPYDIRFPYATMDPIMTFQIYEAQLNVMQNTDINFPSEHSVKDYFFDKTMPSVRAFLDIELEGMIIDWDELEKISIETKKEIEEIIIKMDDIFKVKHNSINWNSEQDIAILFDLLNYTDNDRGKTKPKESSINKVLKCLNESIARPDKKHFQKKLLLTGEPHLHFWKTHGYEKEMTILLEYREISTIYKTFIGNKELGSGFWQYRKYDDRVHSTFGAMLANSHRNWSRNPNMQNNPKHSKKAKILRRIFIPPNNDYTIDEIDAAGFQLRIGAIYSGDEYMREAFIELGGDLHSMTAQKVLKNDITLEEFLSRKGESEIKAVRFKAKSINFQLEFGATAYNFAKSVLTQNWSLQECKDYITKNQLRKRLTFFRGLLNENDNDEFVYYWVVANDIRTKHFETYSGLKTWIDETIEFAESNGYIRSGFGAIRRLPRLLHRGKSDYRSIFKNLQNISLNSPVQNFEAVLMNKLISELILFIKANNYKSRVVGNVHDSIVLYTHRSEAHIIYTEAKRIFEEAIPEAKGIPLLLDVESSDYYRKGEVWGFGSEIKV